MTRIVEYPRYMPRLHPYRRLGIVIDLIVGAILIAVLAFAVGYGIVGHMKPSNGDMISDDANSIYKNHTQICQNDLTGKCWRCGHDGRYWASEGGGPNCDWGNGDADN